MRGAREWADHHIKQGYSKKELAHYLKLHGHQDNHVKDILTKGKKIHHTADTHHHRFSPDHARGYFAKLYAMVQYPELFFSHLQSVNQFWGTKMLFFSILLGITFGLFFWFGLFWSSAFLHIPNGLNVLISLDFTIKSFFVLFTVFFVLQPLYYLLLVEKTHKLPFKKYMSTINFAFTPFIIFGLLPIFNVLGALISTHYVYFALVKKQYTHGLAQWLTYGIGFVLTFILMFGLFSTQPLPEPNACEVFPMGGCSVTQTAWNALILEGVGVPVEVYDQEDTLVCQGRVELDCSTYLQKEAYYFVGPGVSGAFVLG